MADKMQENSGVKVVKSSVLNNDRPTIGLLIESLSGSYQSGVWPGILAVAEENKFNVICFTGGALEKSPDDEWEVNRNVMYDMAEKAELDGMIISGTLCSYVEDDSIQKFISRFSHLPVVSLLPLSDSIPSVSVDNRAGMEELVAHLVGEHKYTKFAFIKGPLGNPEAEERLDLVNDYLTHHGIALNESDLFPGSFNRESGAEAVEKMLEGGRDNLDYDVIVCADDETAFGAIEALREAGLEVPDDLAVVGFDDEQESSYITPPLTTVSQPMHELGVAAAEILLDKMSGKDVDNETILNARLVVRQSCGCFEPKVHNARIKKALIEAVSARQRLKPDDIYNYISGKVSRSLEMFSFDFPQLRDIVDSFCSDVNNKESRLFLQTIDRIGRSKILLGSNLIKWNQFFSTFWYYILAHLDRETFSFADSLLHEARIIRGDLVLRAQGYRRISAKREYEVTHEIGEQISNTLDTDKLIDVIADTLPELGIDNFYLAFYEDGEKPLEKSKIVLAIENGEKKELLDEEALIFETSEIFPKNLITNSGSHIVIMEPLYFHKELFGNLYYMIEKGEYDTSSFEVLGTYISNALHSGYLIEKVTKQNQELEVLRAKEHEHLKNIKGELELGRRIQQSFLPATIYQPEGYSIGIAFKPAREVSGDFYDVFKLDDDSVAIIIADVSGKDVSAALFMSLVKTLLRVYGEEAFKNGDSPLSTINIVNDYVINNHQQPRGRCMFATLLYGILTKSTGEFKYVNAGHNPALLIEKGKIVEELRPSAPAVGLAAGLDFPIQSTIIRPKTFLFNYTDGVTEAQNSEGEFYGMDRVTQFFANRAEITESDSVISELSDSLDEFAKGIDPFDDITMVGLYRE
jgi:DNA-binding LacI/PurR family transcriptional regulator/serine phosphatase RsbU (regulator of sigma subunit)